MGIFIQQKGNTSIKAHRGLTGGLLLLRNFNVAITVSHHVCLILVLILYFCVSEKMPL